MHQGTRDIFVRADVARPWVLDRIRAHGGTPTVAAENVTAPRTAVKATDACGATGAGTWESGPAIPQ